MQHANPRVGNRGTGHVNNHAADLAGRERRHFEIFIAGGTGVWNCRAFLYKSFVPGRGRQEAGGEGVAAEVFHFVLLGQKNFPLEQINGHVHSRKREIGAAFFGERCTGVEKDEGDFVRAVRTKAGAEKRYARTIGALHWFHFLTGHFSGDDAGAGGQADFQERLRLVFHGEFHFGEGFAFDRDESGDDGAFDNGGEHTAVGVAGPSESQRWWFAGLTVITKSSLQWKTRKGAEIRIHFFDIHALQATGFLGGELHGAGAFDQSFAAFALGAIEG